LGEAKLSKILEIEDVSKRFSFRERKFSKRLHFRQELRKDSTLERRNLAEDFALELSKRHRFVTCNLAKDLTFGRGNLALWGRKSKRLDF
jgi:hypothetical protein